MESRITAGDVVQLAMEIEQQGFDFYRQAARRVQAPNVKIMMQALMEDERRHARTFQKLADWLELRMEDVHEDPSWEQRLREIARAQVFPDPMFRDEVIEGLSTEQALLETALSCERRAVRFYQTLRERVTAEGLEVLEEILLEEERHVRVVSEVLTDTQRVVK